MHIERSVVDSACSEHNRLLRVQYVYSQVHTQLVVAWILRPKNQKLKKTTPEKHTHLTVETIGLVQINWNPR